MAIIDTSISFKPFLSGIVLVFISFIVTVDNFSQENLPKNATDLPNHMKTMKKVGVLHSTRQCVDRISESTKIAVVLFVANDFPFSLAKSRLNISDKTLHATLKQK